MVKTNDIYIFDYRCQYNDIFYYIVSQFIEHKNYGDISIYFVYYRINR